MKYITYLLMSFVLLTSCKDFLEEHPETQYSAQEIYNSAKTAQSALNGCYATLISYENYGYRFYYTTSVHSGLLSSTKSGIENSSLASMAAAINDNNVEKMYIGQYATIKVANDIIYNLNLPSNTLDAGVRNQIIGEASYIRALSYFNLVRLFGRTSLIVNPVMSYQESQTPRDSVNKIYKQIVLDLNNAWQDLPAPNDANGLLKAGRPHRYAAKALLAKVYITMATSEELTASEKVGAFDSAYACAKVVYDDKFYSLVPKYADLFDVTKKNSKESIFELQFAAITGTMRLTETTLPAAYEFVPNSNGSNWGKVRPTLTSFDQIYGDPRRSVTFADSIYRTNVNGVFSSLKCYPAIASTTFDKRNYLPFIKKYVDPTFSGASNCNLIVYRYAELLLTLAEAANELDKKDEAITYLNLVLTRARDKDGNGVIAATEKYPLSVDATISKDDLRAKIMLEYQKELLGEGGDWFNTHRRKEVLQELIVRHNTRIVSAPLPPATTLGLYAFPDVVSTPDLLKKILLFPFPVNEITRNDAIPQDDQNFGYK